MPVRLLDLVCVFSGVRLPPYGREEQACATPPRPFMRTLGTAIYSFAYRARMVAQSLLIGTMTWHIVAALKRLCIAEHLSYGPPPPSATCAASWL
jgi:hypothetical protein